MRDASGRSKGCGIVEYRTPVEAQQAINTLLDTELKGRLIFVREDREAAGARYMGNMDRARSKRRHNWRLVLPAVDGRIIICLLILSAPEAYICFSGTLIFTLDITSTGIISSYEFSYSGRDVVNSGSGCLVQNDCSGAI